MSKAKVKEVKKEEVVLPEGMKASDLSAEKRNELFVKRYQKFEAENSEELGMMIGAQLVYSPKGLIPRLVTLDLLKKDEEKQGQ